MAVHVLVQLAVTMGILTQFVVPRCLEDSPEKLPTRHFYYDRRSLPLIIEASDRASHRLSSHILKILLEEILGYPDVVIKTGYNAMNTTDILNRISGCPQTGCQNKVDDSIPDTMINLELWTKAGFSMEPWLLHGDIIDAGPLGPSGRFGWFMPTEKVDENWKDNRRIIDHWRALKMEEVTSQFSLYDQRDLLEGYLTHSDLKTTGRFCQNSRCRRGIDSSQYCQQQKTKCALLLSSYPALTSGILEEQVSNLNLKVAVAWIGEKLDPYLDHLSQTDSAVLFFNWVPNTLTATGNYTRVNFPPCKANHNMDNCDFHINQLSKVMWVRLESHTPEAYHVITRMTFSQEDYEDLLRLYVKLKTIHMASADESQIGYERAACAWLNQNRHKWWSWIPDNLTRKTKIFLGGMFPVTGPYWRQPGIVPGAQMAVRFINDDPTVLQDYELVMHIQDTQCKPDLVMKQFMYYLVNNTHPVAGILGPGCGDAAEPIAGVSKHFNTIIISYSSEALHLSDRAMYPFFFRTVPQITQTSAVLLEIFKTFNWKQVALLSEEGHEFPEYHVFLQDYFISKNVSVIFHRKFLRGLTSTSFVAKYLEAIKEASGRIIILTSFDEVGRLVMCEAYKQGMTAYQGYVWFLPHWFPVDWWDTDTFNRKLGEEVECSTAEMAKALQGHFSLPTGYLGQDNSGIVGNLTVKRWKDLYLAMLMKLRLSNDTSQYASYAYDAVWVFAFGLHELLREDPSALWSLHSEKTAARFLYHLNNTQFMGASGPVQFEGADRTGIIQVKQYLNNNTSLVGQYIPNNRVTQRMSLNTSRIVWFSGMIPVDGYGLHELKHCNVEFFRAFLGVSCDTALVVVNVIGIVAFALIMLFSLLVVKKRYDDKVKATRDRMQELGLLIEGSWLSLDEWEVPREHVVLNRKLGEGAFGMVYGGEALIDEAWLAVAVKTLKIGSNTEEKLDFLSEAEMMKRFDHENIVKLLGVCTRGEPAYNIMEFMLHGDLKTFLLSRRHLAGQESKEAEDVTPERLTKMAFDIAQGLKYLTELNYVHRDLACRNCLVHASKTVKIGDFGMTRPMYDSDYYRFNKRGMLPVRWMAPESLVDGLFTSSSDIWSYGVLLYEIMTFGSFPYQGLSNKQVLEHVKSGTTISLSMQCSENLKGILLPSWSYNPESRPSVDQIIAMLKENPLLVTPCLDAPRTAVPHDSNESAEIALSRKTRHKSTHRTTSEMSNLRRMSSVDSRSFGASPAPSLPPESISFLSNEMKSNRLSQTAVIRSPVVDNSETAEDRTFVPRTMKGSSSFATNCGVRQSASATTMPETESSPETPIEMRRLTLSSEDDKGDSDYCSNHSNRILQSNNAAAV